ncbi:hypothetical protein [Methanosarcina siciliae]|uniref:hypothetical protein n=1 Tax=Methanosarcina siciliae TaxID=38027 RepID=UPI0012E073DC|nr:hypothetical protein [Methanosarcina siciliae]
MRYIKLPIQNSEEPEVFERFIKYLDKQEIETLKVLSAPRFWDYYLFEALVKKFNTGYPLTSFSDLGNFSFTSRNHDGKWYMHQLMKEGLQEYQARELRERVHRFIFDYYTEKLRSCHKISYAASSFLGLNV